MLDRIANFCKKFSNKWFSRESNLIWIRNSRINQTCTYGIIPTFQRKRIGSQNAAVVLISSLIPHWHYINFGKTNIQFRYFKSCYFPECEQKSQSAWFNLNFSRNLMSFETSGLELGWWFSKSFSRLFFFLRFHRLFARLIPLSPSSSTSLRSSHRTFLCFPSIE